jgi:hypothetical protein
MQHDVSMLRYAIAPGEMEAVNKDIARFRRELNSLIARRRPERKGSLGKTAVIAARRISCTRSDLS